MTKPAQASTSRENGIASILGKLPMRARERALYVMLFALLLALIVAPTATMLGSSGLGLSMWIKGLLGK